MSEADELVARLSAVVDELVRKDEALARSLEDERLRAQTAEQRADTAEQRAMRLAKRLHELGVNPDED